MPAAIGYTEPSSGTDLASLKTRATLEEGGFRVNGSKIYTSHAEGADYIWLAARTDPSAKPHNGISILLLDTRSEGFSLTPMDTVAGMHTNITFYDNVWVPGDMLVGELHGGWKLITSQLNYERIGIAARGIHGEDLYLRRLLWARETRDGRRPIDEPAVQRLLASVYARLETLRILNLRLAWSLCGDQAAEAGTGLTLLRLPFTVRPEPVQSVRPELAEGLRLAHPERRDVIERCDGIERCDDITCVNINRDEKHEYRPQAGQ